MIMTKVSGEQILNPLEIASEYRQLFSLSSLTEQQQQRMREILELAAENEDIDFWISNIESDEGATSDLWGKQSRKSYWNQRALISEHLDYMKPRESLLIKQPKLGMSTEEPTATYGVELPDDASSKKLWSVCKPEDLQPQSSSDSENPQAVRNR
jgi:hypothetical protein